MKDLFAKERTEYENFWSEFGATLKEGLPAEPALKEKLQDLLLFHSTHSDKMTSLDEYVARMKTEQKDIYFITGDSLSQVSSSPYLEKLKEKGLEVLLMVDPVDEWVVNSLPDFKGKTLQSITKQGLDLDSSEEKKVKEEEKTKLTQELTPVLEILKKHLNGQVKDVVLSDRLTETPVCLVSSDGGMSTHMHRILSQMGQKTGETPQRILEINPKHAVFQKILKAPEIQQQKWSEMLYAQALLNEGSMLPDPVKFSKQIAELMVEAQFPH